MVSGVYGVSRVVSEACQKFGGEAATEAVDWTEINGVEADAVEAGAVDADAVEAIGGDGEDDGDTTPWRRTGVRRKEHTRSVVVQLIQDGRPSSHLIWRCLHTSLHVCVRLFFRLYKATFKKAHKLHTYASITRFPMRLSQSHRELFRF